MNPSNSDQPAAPPTPEPTLLTIRENQEAYCKSPTTFCISDDYGHGRCFVHELVAQWAALAAEHARLTLKLRLYENGTNVNQPLVDDVDRAFAATTQSERARKSACKAASRLGVKLTQAEAERDRLRADLQQAREQIEEPSGNTPDRLKLNAYGRRCYDAGAKAMTADRDRLQRRWDALRAWLEQPRQNCLPDLPLGPVEKAVFAGYADCQHKALAAMDHLAAKEQ